jgi:hypothetical protein
VHDTYIHTYIHHTYILADIHICMHAYIHTCTHPLILHSHHPIPISRHLQRTIENVNAICGSFYQEQFLEAAEVLDETHNDVSVDELRERMEKGV